MGSGVLPEVPAIPPDETKIVAVVGTLIVICLILSAYFTDRRGGVDEHGLYNPTYMSLRDGKMTYPIHGYFHTMVVHPPVHYALVALFMRLGMGLYYAQATPTLLMLLVCVVLILRSPFPASHKIGFLLAIYAPIAVFAKLKLECFGMRPENHLNAAWVAGLVALESARLENWNLKKLFAGAFLITYASGLHYYAVPSFLGVAVYAVWALSQSGWSGARRPLLALTGGGLLFGVPYLVLFAIPNWTEIVSLIRSAQGFGGIGRALTVHLGHYKYLAEVGLGGPWLSPALSLGLPLVLLSTPLMLAFPSTRGIGLASLPLQLSLLLIIGRKNAFYFIHEITVFGAVLFAGVLVLAEYIHKKLGWSKLRTVMRPALALVIAAALMRAHLAASKIVVSGEPRVHEAEIARAAGREMLGPDALVGGRLGLWYASGAAHWYCISPDLLWQPIKFDLPEYFRRFDALAEHLHMSDATSNDQLATLSSWYADGTLRLSGFYFAEVDDDLTYLLLSADAPERLVGLGLKNQQLYRFVENPGSDYEVVSYACPLTDAVHNFRQRTLFSSLLYLPNPRASQPRQGFSRTEAKAGHRVVLTAIVPWEGPPLGLPRECREFQRVRGALVFADHKELVAKLRREDRPMRFYQKLEDLPKRDPATGSLPGPHAPPHSTNTLPKPVAPKVQ